MENEVQNYFKEFVKSTQKMAQDIPDVVKSFQGLVEKSLAPGALDTKVKEFVALGILAYKGAAKEVLAAHIKRAMDNGATKEELVEVLETTTLPGGAPTLFNGLKALLDVIK